MPTRWIPPGSRWDLAHDPTGTVYIGVSHEKCNRSEAAKRGNRMRGRPPTTVKKPANRWVI